MAACRNCGALVPEAARFCPACGTAVGGPAGEERKVVTVLFADLVDSTTSADARDPEDVRAALRPHLARIRGELERFGGTFEKYVGDAVMAVFGAPVAHEDDPERAVRAALAIRDGLSGVRVAVNTGEAVVSLGAASGTSEGIATGDVVNTTFRIEEAAEAETVLVGESTYRATQDVIEYGERRLVQAKGKAEPLAVYEAVRASSELRRAYDGRPLAPLVGRKEELNLIIGTLARARRDQNVQLVTLLGVPGIGKSRVVWELEHALAPEPGLVTWRRGRCLPYGEGVTYWALGEMVKTQAGILESDGPDAAATKLARAVADLIADTREAAWVDGHLRPLLGLAPPPGDRGEDAFAAWRRFFEALAAWGPLVLLFEDLHWADTGLLDFIDHLADWAMGPLLILCTARPELWERRSEWGARANATTVGLSPLNADETTTLATFLLREAAIPEELVGALIARSEGNPLYTEELVRMVLERRLLYREGGRLRLRADELPLPESLQALIAARIDALRIEEKSTLQDAAVVGRHFWPGAVAAVGGRPEKELGSLLRRLEQKELVRHQRSTVVEGEVQHAFHHALVRDVAYGQIPRAQRAQRHLRAAEWVEGLGRPQDHAEMLAHHYLSVLEYGREIGDDVRARATRALREAGDRALALNAFAAAARFFEGALRLVADADPDLLFAYAKALFDGEERGTEELVAARDALLSAGERGRAAECESMLTWLAWYAGNHADAFAHAERARELAVGLPIGRSRAEVVTSAARFLVVADQPEQAIGLAHEALALSEQAGADDLRLIGLTYLGTARVSLGDLEGIRDLEQAIELGRELRSPELVRSLVNLAAIHVGLGDLTRAFELHGEARLAATRLGHARGARWLRGELVGECYWTGRWDEAVRLADEFLAEGEHYLASFCLTARGKVFLGRGDTAKAAADAEQAVRLARDANDAQVLYPAVAFAAEVEAACANRDAANALVDELLASYSGAELVTAGPAWASLSRAAAALGRGGEIGSVVERARLRTRWLDAAQLVASGRWGEAADVYEKLGSRADAEAARAASVAV